MQLHLALVCRLCTRYLLFQIIQAYKKVHCIVVAFASSSHAQRTDSSSNSSGNISGNMSSSSKSVSSITRGVVLLLVRKCRSLPPVASTSNQFSRSRIYTIISCPASALLLLVCCPWFLCGDLAASAWVIPDLLLVALPPLHQ